MRVRASEPALYVLVALLAVGWITGFTISVGGVPATPDAGLYPQLLIAAVVIAAPWFVAIRLVWRRWWTRTGADLATLDPPAQLLAAAVAATPRHRRDWGAAMLAELDQVRDPAERWAFAVSSARAAAFPPRIKQVPTYVVAALGVAAVAAAGLTISRTMPALQVFGVTFVALLGVLALVTTARSRRILRPPAAGFVVTAVGLAAVAACVAAVGYFLTEFPIGALHLPPAAAVFLAAALAGAVWLVLNPPRGLVTSPQARYVGAGIALSLAAVLFVLSQRGLNDAGPLSVGILGFLFLAPVPVLLVGSLTTAFANRSFRTGAQTAVWAAVLTSLAFFAVALLEAINWYHVGSSLILAADGIPLVAVGENLRNFSWGLILFPSWWLPFGLLGAALGHRIGTLVRRHARGGDVQGLGSLG
ncbi:hypothetical protein [Tenggerimyces flavus]|uniref:Uncharacterized protein n=1 Tax=Tenggerimyces flavus TaxID=1708749 RepID=A0ABV7Y9B1_9ACTN|nr:hypothetical protein [Tenggerimyces flavus]MBM7785617.1 hypothetical protein [Tenggerimyces flavus]